MNWVLPPPYIVSQNKDNVWSFCRSSTKRPAQSYYTNCYN